MSLIKDDFEASEFKGMGKFPIHICAGTRAHVQNELDRFPPKLVVWCGAGEGYSPQKIASSEAQPEALDLDSLLLLLNEHEHAKPEHIMVCLEAGSDFAVGRINQRGASLRAHKIDDMYDPSSTSSPLIEGAIPAIGQLDIDLLEGRSKGNWLELKDFGTRAGHTNITASDETKNRPLSGDLDQIQTLASIVKKITLGKYAKNKKAKLLIVNQAANVTESGDDGSKERYCRAAALAYAVCLNLLGPSSSYLAVFWVNRLNGTLKKGGLKQVCRKINELKGDAKAGIKKVLVWFDLREDNGSSPSPENNWLAKARGSDAEGLLQNMLDTDDVYFVLTGVGEANIVNNGREQPSRAPSLLHGDAWELCTEHWPDAFSEWHKENQIEVHSLESSTDSNGSRAANLHENIFFAIEGSSDPIGNVLKMVQASLPDKRKLASLYYDDQETGLEREEVKYIARLCISDVDYLHRVRDCVLNGTFSQTLGKQLGPIKDAHSMPALPAATPAPTPNAAGGSTADSSEGKHFFDDVDGSSVSEAVLTDVETPAPTHSSALSTTPRGVKVDHTRFAEGFEESMLKLDQLTLHQEAKIGELLDVLRVQSVDEPAHASSSGAALEPGAHLKAPAGAGKTFVAMDVMLKHLLANRYVSTPVPILYVTRNVGLSYSVGAWMHKRMSAAGISHDEIAELLTNVHILSDAEEAKEMKEVELRTSSLHGTALAVVAAQRFNKGPLSGVMSPTPFSKGVRKFQLNGSEDVLDLLPVTHAAPYRLIVVDEAHHIYRSPLRLAAVAKIQAESNAQLLLLSDMSQATATAHSIPFPEGLVSVCLTQVVRSSKKIVLASMVSCWLIAFLSPCCFIMDVVHRVHTKAHVYFPIVDGIASLTFRFLSS